MSQTHIIDESAYYNAVQKRIIANAQKTFGKNPENLAVLDFLYENQHKEFYGKLLNAYNTYGKLSERQCECVHKAIADKEVKKAQWAADKAAAAALSNHKHQVGEKIQINVTVKAVIEIQGQSFYYGHSGVSYLFILTDAAENIYTYKGNSSFYPKKGEQITVKASVKENTVYNGAKQTVIVRPKIIG